MNVLFLHQHFATREGAGGTRTWEFSQQLLARGHTVTMVAQLRRGGGIEEAGRHQVEGMDLIMLPGWYTNHLSFTQRIWQFILFIVRASKLRDLPHRPDVVIASSTPLTIGIPGWILARRHRVPFVFEVRDLWPEAPIQLGVVKSPLLKRAAVWLERFLYRNADVVIPLSPGMEAGVLAAGCAPEKVVTIPNASDIDLFAPEHRDRALLEPWGFEDKFVAVHAGMMGEANGLDYVAKAAEVLRDRGEDDIAILVVGEGITKARLERFAAERGLTNIIFTGMIPREQLGAIVSSCDTCLVSFADFPVLQTNSPNKLFDGFAAGLPAIVNSAGWTKRLVEANDAGAYVDVTKPEELADALVTLRDDPELRARQAANAHRLGTEVFARERLSTRFADVLEFAATIRNGQPTMPAELRAPLIPESAQEPTAPA
ncbi:MAG: glycosyl transferase group 1 [Thermoleophilia bacterium]|nr:glycosyl transferase group 1 [Thermoleophilia bacterium]